MSLEGAMTLRDLEKRVLELGAWVDEVETSRVAVEQALKRVDTSNPLDAQEWRAAMDAWQRARNDREVVLDVLARGVAALVAEVRAREQLLAAPQPGQ